MLLTKQEKEIGIKMLNNVFVFIEEMWGLSPQPIKKEYESFVEICIEKGDYNEVKKEHFQPFVKYKHITWMQYLILSAYQKAINKEDKREVSVVSGHGIGKSATLAWIIFHFLFAYENSNIACTAPSKEQMFGVLWKEAALWHSRMRNTKIKKWFEITSDKIYVIGRDKFWWARAKTASKEKPEALSGVHSDNVLLLVDEASGVDEAVFENAMGSLTNENYVFIMISNGTKDNGLFYRSHNSEDDSQMYQKLQFSSEDSPVVDPAYCRKTLKKAHGDKDDDLYRVRVRGLFPKKGSIENKNWYRLVKTSTLNEVDDDEFYEWDPQKTVMGIDPAGKGQDETVWVLRDNYRMKMIGWEKVSSEFTIARKTWAYLQYYKIVGCPIVIDNFGEGANVGMEIANMSNIPNFSQFIYPINVGDTLSHPKLKEKYFNYKAYYYDLLASWILRGGEVVSEKRFREEMPALMYTFDERGKIKMMSKRTLVAEEIDSPNCWEAAMLTFKFFDINLLNAELNSEKYRAKNRILSSTQKNSNINNESDFLNDYL